MAAQATHRAPPHGDACRAGPNPRGLLTAWGAQTAVSTLRSCFSPPERLGVEPTAPGAELARRHCPPYAAWRPGETTAREGERASATHAAPPPVRRRSLRRANALCFDTPHGLKPSGCSVL